MEEDIVSKNKEEFIRLFVENIKRDGSQSLLEWLKSSDFFTAPASTHFHSATEGGLCYHSLRVYARFKANLKMEHCDKLSEESIAIVALLHDVCKVDSYKVDYKNVKVNGVWVKKPYYTVSESFPYGHGEKSVYLISQFMKLTREEAMMINWHMGGFDTRVLGGSRELNTAFRLYPTAVIFHVSDVEATYLDEKA